MTKPRLSYELTTAVLATADAFLRESQRLFRPLGLTGAQFNVLNILADEREGMSQRELGDRLVVDRSNVTGLLDRLEKAGLVQRRDHPGDRRVYRVSLTPAGRRLWARAQPRYLDVLAQVTRGLTAAEMRACLGALQHLEAAAAQWELTARSQMAPRRLSS
ncbi:MAG TPA: MarR family transcriptional regulator [Opitutaceae bacterium]|nr:MarR family transcriptional regulator [Opitutaceae bacterium]